MPIETVEKDTDRDNFMSAEEAKKYGLIDKIYAKRYMFIKIYKRYFVFLHILILF